MDGIPLVTWNVALQKLHTICCNWLQPVTEDTKTGKTNLFIGVGLVTPCGRTVIRRGHRGGCWEDGHTLCLLNLVLVALISEVRENVSSSILKIRVLFLIGLNVRIRPTLGGQCLIH